MCRRFSRYLLLLRIVLAIFVPWRDRREQSEGRQAAELSPNRSHAPPKPLPPLQTASSAIDAKHSALPTRILNRSSAQMDGPAPLNREKKRAPSLSKKRRKNLAGKRILIAEDDTINARLIQCMVHRAGCRSVIATTGQAAVDAVRASLQGKRPRIDLVLMDVHMPDLDGLAAAQQIRRLTDDLTSRAQLPAKRPPLIAITANAFPEDRQICLDAGMDDYLAKPFSWPEFNALLARWLSDDHSNGEDTGRDVRAA